MSETILNAVVGGAATVLVAFLGMIGVIASSRKTSKDKPPVGDTGAALDRMSGTQNEFMQLLIADNRSLRDGLRETNEKAEAALEQVSTIRQSQETFVSAVRRYLVKIAAAWVGPQPMPVPDENDFHILEDTLPVRPGTNRKEIL